MSSEKDPSHLHRSLADRLRQGDKSALADILKYLAPDARSRLRGRFGPFLSEDDCDDVLSMALYRLWMSREKYNPEKSSLAAWFYLIVRSLAWDFLRQRPRPPHYAAERLVEQAPARPPHETRTPQSEDVKQLILAMDGLAEIDRRILLGFASRTHDDDWTSDLVAELGMPASTIRVRKFRAIAELRGLLSSASVSSSKGDTGMTSSAKAADFVMSHWDLIQKIVQKLLAFKARRAKIQATAGVAQVEAEWNAALTGEESNERNLEGLKKTYAWLTALASPSNEYRERLGDFLRGIKFDRQIASGSFDEQLGDLEQAFSTVTTKIELKMPEEVCRNGVGEIHLEYPSNDVSFRWQGNLSGPPLLLRKLVNTALAPSPRFTGQCAEAVATCLVKSIHATENLPLPNLYYPAGSKTLDPQKLLWRRAKPPELKVPARLPKWMQENQFAPSEAEIDLFQNDAELADMLEIVATKAALLDWQAQQAGKDAPASAVQSLGQALVQRSGLTKAEIVALLTPKLFDRQQRVASAQECAANTNAIDLLWAEISG